MKKAQYRSVQIDLARQIETVDTVKAYFDTAAKAGMNMVILYLEDRIRTETYPYPSAEESYTPDQIRDMVAYADKLGLELVPVVSPIGHTERFLEHEALRPMAEMYGDIEGRFNNAGEKRGYCEACPKKPQTQQFMERHTAVDDHAWMSTIHGGVHFAVAEAEHDGLITNQSLVMAFAVADDLFMTATDGQLVVNIV